MDATAAVEILRAHRDDLRRQGVMRAALFGSVARGESTALSDLDIMVDIDPAANVDLYRFAGIVRYIAELFPGRVDVSDRTMLVEQVRKTAERDALYAF